MNTRLNSAKICQFKVAESSGTGITLTGTGTSSSLPVGTDTSLSGTGTTCPLHHEYRYHFLVSVPIHNFAQKTLDFCLFIHFSSTNLLQSIPYKKSTMESTQNNSKSGLESMKTSFLKLGLFPQIKIIKEEVRVLFFLPYLFKSPFVGCMISLEQELGSNPTKANPPCKP